jgi:hypothetical protein
VNEDLEIRVEGLEVLDEFETVLAVKVDLDNQKFRSFLGEFSEGFLRSGACPDNAR